MEFRGLTLDTFQEQAIGKLAEGGSVLVCAPTGTGKTLVADWIVTHAIETKKSVIYTAPIKALSNQKFRDYCNTFGEENVGLVTGDLVIRRDAPIRVMTTEILRNMLLSGEDLSSLLAVVIDEIHFLDDRDRGTVWEEVLIYLPNTVQIIGLSATLSNVREFASWLSHVRQEDILVVEEHQRAVPLEVGFANKSTGLSTVVDFEDTWKKKKAIGRHTETRANFKGQRKGKNRDRNARRKQRYIRKTRDTDVVQMVVDNDLLPMLYFAFSRRDIEMYARSLMDNTHIDLLSDREHAQLTSILEQAQTDLGPVLSRGLRRLYSRGVAFHHAGLHVQLKVLVESLYEQRLIKVLYCTSTFALGINMPARTVVFDGLKKFNGQQVAPLSVRQFMQKAGRAGRRGLDEYGNVYIRMDFDEYDEWKPIIKHYQKGRSEPVHSRFGLSWNSVANLVHRYERKQVRELVERSFLNWHFSKEAERQLQRADAIEQKRNAKKSGVNKTSKEVKRLRKRAARSGQKCWDTFQHKVNYLKQVGYISRDGSFNAGGLVILHLQISEILITEIVLAGIFEELDSNTMFGILCGLVSDFPRKVRPLYNLTKQERKITFRIQSVRESKIVLDAEDLTDTEYSWAPMYMPIGRMWAQGATFSQIIGRLEYDTDVSSDIISAFRRAKDLAGQLREVYRDDPTMLEILRDLIRDVSRDEVEVVG